MKRKRKYNVRIDKNNSNNDRDIDNLQRLYWISYNKNRDRYSINSKTVWGHDSIKVIGMEHWIGKLLNPLETV